MSIYSGPEIDNTGLVLYYDVGNVQKSFIGMPMVNQFLLPEVDVNGFQVQNSTFTRVRSGTFGGYTIQPTDYVWRYNISVNDCPYHGNDVAITAGTTATFSFDYYVDPSTTNYVITNFLANFEGVVGGSATDPTPAITGVWKRAVFSSTAGSSGTCRMLLYPGACGGRLGDSGFILYRNPQVQFNAPGNVPSPFVAGTRSNTQALLDMTQTTTITANSLTYNNSNNTFSFNGSSDFCSSVGNFPFSFTSNSFTISYWLNVTATSSNYGVVQCGVGPFNSGGSGVEIRYQGTTMEATVADGVGAGIRATLTSALTTGQWNNFAFVFNRSTLQGFIYRNGVLETTQSFAGEILTVTAFQLLVGRGNDGFLNGRLEVLTIYNTALDAGQINQNFQALRSRFGI